MSLVHGRRAGRRALAAVAALVRPPPNEPRRLSPEEIVTAVYRAMLERDPDPEGLAANAAVVRSGAMLEHALRAFVNSAEFRARAMRTLVPQPALPDLTQLMPEKYAVPAAGAPTLYLARTDADIDLMDGLIRKHRYYDRFDVWSPVIDADKRIIAAVVRGLGARSCFELGCFTGPVLSVLADNGVAVTGCDASHHAFAFAYPNIRDSLIFGDLLEVEIDRKFDVIVCMDVLEHLNPLRLDRYIARLLSLLEDDGAIYLNSPMWGPDEVFGTVAEPFVDGWGAVGDADFWREWPCDATGWPQHGHLVWASPNWWTARFAAHGLRRDAALERVVHDRLKGFFELAPSRRSLFVLRPPGAPASGEAEVAALEASLDEVAELAK